MSPDRIEDLAYRNTGMPEGLNAAEQMLFQGLRRLYAYARMVGMDPQQGRWEKSELLQEFSRRSFELACMEASNRLWKEIEAAGNRFGRERTLESAEAFYQAVYRCGLKDVQALRERQKAKGKVKK